MRNTIKKEMGINVNIREPLGTFQQTFSHFKLTLRVFSCETMDRKGKGKWVSIQGLNLYPMSRIHRRIADAIDGEMGNLGDRVKKI